MLAFWAKFDLDSRRLALDKQGLEMHDARDASAKARKRLAEVTKEFRRKHTASAAGAEGGGAAAAAAAAPILADLKPLLGARLSHTLYVYIYTHAEILEWRPQLAITCCACACTCLCACVRVYVLALCVCAPMRAHAHACGFAQQHAGSQHECPG